jgi:tyrosyl-tRNA synthetase
MTDIYLPELIAETFGGSRSEARRVMSQGGVKLRGSTLRPENGLDFAADDLNGELQVGNTRRAFLVNGEVRASA